MEDIQPNEIRLSRKGSARVPTVRSSHWRGRGRGYGMYRINPSGSQPSPRPIAQHVSHHPPSLLTSLEAPYNGRDVLVNPGHQLRPINQQERQLKRARTGTATEGQPVLGRLGEKRPKHVDLTVQLPSECLKGVAGSHKARAKWLSERKQCIEREHGLSVVNIRYLEQSIIFTCKEKGPVKRTTNSTAGSSNLLRWIC